MEEHKYSLEELRARSRSVINMPDLVAKAKEGSPNSAYREALIESGSIRKAKATRFLAMLRRDYGEESFDQTVGQPS